MWITTPEFESALNCVDKFLDKDALLKWWLDLTQSVSAHYQLFHFIHNFRPTMGEIAGFIGMLITRFWALVLWKDKIVTLK